ncbi:acid phosphatase [Massilia sp. TS11]|uniref:acid phosphatase n=1 Tax=Massilia sp. TS11 TaxID=2908003 RepID=UPI001ED9FF1E|nr:acid phosphatase [Massilia sp. TS11]MCG2582934.1 acid phosphatase [Massilia sp. TS11]
MFPSRLALAVLAAVAGPAAQAAVPAGLDQIQTVVVLYGENRSFNNLYGLFPGANGIAQALQHYQPQRDRDGSVLASLPPVWRDSSEKDAQGKPLKGADPRYPSALPNAPFRIDAAPIQQGLAVKTRDLTHRFYQNQMQINGGRNDMFVAWTDAGALTMGHYDGAVLPLWQIAREYTLADNFFMAAFGGSFLNHMWLACACTPHYPGVPEKLKARLDERGQLMLRPGSPARASEGPPQFYDGSYSPDGYAINTAQSSYQPSGIAPAAGGDPLRANPAETPLPPLEDKTIGDALSEKQVSWAWYAGGYQAALQDRRNIYGGEVNFQPHHQPYNYFRRYAPGSAERAAHLKDGSDFLAAIQSGSLPQVSFYKPHGPLNEHPGYASVLDGDRHLADLVRALQASPQWPHMAIIITYDENGGLWDHVAPPQGDRWGPGSRIPAIIVSPFAKRGFVDHTSYDTTSILQFLSKRFGLTPLPGIRQQMGDLTNAFDFSKR